MGRNAKKHSKRKPGRCTRCKGLVAGHIGRPGKSCTNLTDNQLANLTSSEMASSQDPEPNRPGRTEGDPEPEDDYGISNFNDLRNVTKGLQDCLESLSDRLRDLQTEVFEIRQSRDRSRSRSRTYNSFQRRDPSHNRDEAGASWRPRVTEEESSGNHLESRESSRNTGPSMEWGPPPPLSLPTPVRAVVAPGTEAAPEARPPVQARQRRRQVEPRLRPVAPDLDLSGLPLVSGISERSVKTALSGQFVSLDLFLSNLCLKPEEDKSEEEKSRSGKRSIYNVLSWMEAWENYSRLMVTYHGLEMFLVMSDYKLQMLNWDRKYIWKACYSFDMQHRGELANRNSVNFMDIDMLESSNTFDNSVLKPFATRCSVCRSYNHIFEACPFRGASDPPPPPPGVGRRNQSLAPRYTTELCLNWNAQRCGNPRCPRIHVCKGCGGEFPYEVCKYKGNCASPPNLPNTNMPPPNIGGNRY